MGRSIAKGDQGNMKEGSLHYSFSIGLGAPESNSRKQVKGSMFRNTQRGRKDPKTCRLISSLSGLGMMWGGCRPLGEAQFGHGLNSTSMWHGGGDKRRSSQWALAVHCSPGAQRWLDTCRKVSRGTRVQRNPQELRVKVKSRTSHSRNQQWTAQILAMGVGTSPYKMWQSQLHLSGHRARGQSRSATTQQRSARTWLPQLKRSQAPPLLSPLTDSWERSREESRALKGNTFRDIQTKIVEVLPWVRLMLDCTRNIGYFLLLPGGLGLLG